MLEQKLNTDFGTLWTGCSIPPSTAKPSLPILFLHGNSVHSRIFEPLLSQPRLRDNYKLITFDYPGHGRSEDAPEPDKAYWQYGYAKSAIKVLQHYGVKECIAVGWSLGGAVALELVSMLLTSENTTNIHIFGVMVTGTSLAVKKDLTVAPPKGFDGSALCNPEASKEDLMKVATIMTKSDPEWLRESILRTNRAAGRTMAVKFRDGFCVNQIEVIHGFQNGWVAIVNGGDEFPDYLDRCDEVCKGAPHLWQGKCIRMPGQTHSPFYDDPEGYCNVLIEFLNDCNALHISQQ